jgi:hypothetical protein
VDHLLCKLQPASWCFSLFTFTFVISSRPIIIVHGLRSHGRLISMMIFSSKIKNKKISMMIYAGAAGAVTKKWSSI